MVLRGCVIGGCLIPEQGRQAFLCYFCFASEVIGIGGRASFVFISKGIGDLWEQGVKIVAEVPRPILPNC